MNKLIVPASPNWYNVQILACAPDDTLVYGAKNDLVIIHHTSNEEPLQIKFLDNAHSQKVISVDVNIQWGSPNKRAVTSGEDNSVVLWDIEKLSKISSHEAHKEQTDKLVGARFLTEDRVLSVSENGSMFIWHPSTKENTKVNNFFFSKVSISCFSPCPHATFITAFGLKNGLIVVGNLKKNGSLMYKLRGHTTDIVSLSWCPAPINIFPSSSNNYIKGTIQAESKVCCTSIGEEKKNQIEEPQEKTVFSQNSETIANVEHSKILDENNLTRRVADDDHKQNPWVNLKFPDDDEVQCIEEPAREIKVYDFLEECDSLKKKIEDLSTVCDSSLSSSFNVDNIEDGALKKNEKGIIEKRKKFDEAIATRRNVEEQKKLGVSEETPLAILKFVDNDEVQYIEEPATKIEAFNCLEESNFKTQDLSVDCAVSPKKTFPSDVKDEKTEHIEERSLNEKKFKNESEIQLSGSKDVSLSDSVEGKHICAADDSSKNQNVPKNSERFLDACDDQNNYKESQIEITEYSPSETISIKSSEEEPKKEYLLASSGKDSTIYIWRAGTDGRMQCFFKLPEKKVHHYKGKKPKDSTWTVVKWVSPFTLLTATKKGELLKYTLPKPLDSTKQYTVIHNEHSSLIFAIVASAPVLTADNWLSNLTTTFWTFGHDMYLLNTVLDSKTTHLVTMETLCALVQCLAQSPLDPSRVAMGLSNGTIRIWNTNDPHVKSFSTVNYSPKIYSKISCLAWHPTNEMLLAFSTEEGTVGFLNTNHLQKATWFKQTFANAVHKIQWGPCSQSKHKYRLYATGGSHLVHFDPEEPNAEPIEVKLPADTSVYTFAWKLDKSTLLVADRSGKIIVFTSNLSVKATYYQKKKISILAWHPDSECNSERNSSMSHWAAASVDNSVHILDFAELSIKHGTLDIQDITKIVLDGHQGNIKCLAWSPFNENRLVTAGEDGIANVWDTSTGQVLSSYYGENFQPIKSIIWSPIHEDILICSVTNARLIVWKMTDYPAPLDKDILEKCKLHLKNEKINNTSKEDDSMGKSMKKMKKSLKNAILPVLNCSGNDSTQEKVKILQELVNWKENGNSVKANGVPNIKQLFGTKEDVSKLLSVTETSHMERGKHEAASMVSFWKGDLQNSIKEAIDQRRVTSFLISLAPTVSLSLWQKACETFAQQLEEKTDSDPLEIATYYISCQNIEKAISCLCEREMFKEALALAKCRLPEDNVFVEDILQKWANFSAYCGSLETAAQCYIVLGKFEEAAKVLFRRSEVNILNFAHEMAKKSNNSELIKAVEFRCKAFATGEGTEQVESFLPDKKALLLGTEDNSSEKDMKNVEIGSKLEEYVETSTSELELAPEVQNNELKLNNGIPNTGEKDKSIEISGSEEKEATMTNEEIHETLCNEENKEVFETS